MRTPPFPPVGNRTRAEQDASLGGSAPSHETESGDAVPVHDEAPRLREAGTEEVIPVAEEVVRLGKRQVETGRVRIRTHVDVVTEPVHAALATESVEVTRVPVDRPVDRIPEVRTEGGVTIVPVVEEVLVVEKRWVLKEELHIRRNTQTENVEIPVELRKHRVEIERIPASDEREAGK